MNDRTPEQQTAYLAYASALLTFSASSDACSEAARQGYANADEQTRSAESAEKDHIVMRAAYDAYKATLNPPTP